MLPPVFIMPPSGDLVGPQDSTTICVEHTLRLINIKYTGNRPIFIT